MDSQNLHTQNKSQQQPMQQSTQSQHKPSIQEHQPLIQIQQSNSQQHLWQYLEKQMEEIHSNNSPISSSSHLQPNQHPQHTQSFLSTILSPHQLTSYKCPHCPTTLTIRSHLYRHIRQKHQQKHPSYKCNHKDCNKQFKRGSHLKRHMISHTHIKNYKCLMCVMQFGYKHHLQRHIKIKHQLEKFKCSFSGCLMEFNKKKALNRHIENQHAQIKNCQDEDQKRERKSPPIQQQEQQCRQVSKISQNGERSYQLLQQNYQKEIPEQPQQQNNPKPTHKQKQQKITKKQSKKIKRQQKNSNPDSQSQNQNKQQKNTTSNKTKTRIKLDKQQIYYRCPYQNCISAYKANFLLRKHISQKHGAFDQPGGKVDNNANNNCL